MYICKPVMLHQVAQGAAARALRRLRDRLPRAPAPALRGRRRHYPLTGRCTPTLGFRVWGSGSGVQGPSLLLWGVHGFLPSCCRA